MRGKDGRFPACAAADRTPAADGQVVPCYGHYGGTGRGALDHGMAGSLLALARSRTGSVSGGHGRVTGAAGRLDGHPTTGVEYLLFFALVDTPACGDPGVPGECSRVV